MSSKRYTEEFKIETIKQTTKPAMVNANCCQRRETQLILSPYLLTWSG